MTLNIQRETSTQSISICIVKAFDLLHLEGLHVFWKQNLPHHFMVNTQFSCNRSFIGRQRRASIWNTRFPVSGVLTLRICTALSLITWKVHLQQLSIGHRAGGMVRTTSLRIFAICISSAVGLHCHQLGRK